MKIIQGQDKVILRAVSPDGGTTSGDLLTAFAEDGGTTGIRISNLEVETQTTLNSTTTTIEDSFLEVNRNNSTADGEDSGLFFNRGSEDHALLYWDSGDDNFVVGTTTHEATVTAVSNITLGQIKIATTPSNANHAASKSYVDSRTITIAGDDSAAITIDFDDAELVFTGGTSITTDTTAGGNSVKISVDAAMTGINSITSGSSTNLTLSPTTNLVVIDDFLTFANNQSDPSAAAVSKFYAKTPGTGGTGLFVINSAIDGGEASELLGATSADLKIFGDDSTTMEVNLPTQELHIKGGNGITTSTSSTQTLTIALDSELLTVNELSSLDSTGITIKDDLLLAGTLRAEDSTNISVDGGMQISGVVTGLTIEATGDTAANDNAAMGYTAAEGLILTGQGSTNDVTIKNDADADVIEIPTGTTNVTIAGTLGTGGSITATGSFIIGSADMNEADLEKLDGITNGAGAANKALVLDGSANIASGLAAVTASGVITAAGFTIGSAVIDETDLEKIDGITNGTVAANKAVVVDASKDIGTFGTITGSALVVENISSADSTAVVINDGLDVIGTLQVSDIGGHDSTAVQINEDLNVNGNVRVNTKNIHLGDSGGAFDGNIMFGAGDDLQISHDGSNSFINDAGTGSLQIQTNSQIDITGGGENIAKFIKDGAVELYHNNVKIIETTAAGTTVSGVVTATGFTIGSAVINETELETIDGITAGTVIASKALVADANIDITGGRNITISGELDAATLDISGATTIDGLTTLAGSFKQAVHTFVATDAITEAEHAGRILLLGEVGGNAEVTLTLPDATGSGNVYEFFVTVQNTSNYVIKVPDADNTISGQIMYLDEDGTAVSSFPTVSASDTITINGGTTGGLIGDTIKLVDIAADKFAVQGQMRVAAGANPATPFSATVS
tara:strand:- start:3 stop:2738 length:2736 start_codon:yes stop_codon:yes gene_type:complete